MNTGSEKRKAAALSRIMEDRQVTLDEAIEIYRERFRLLGSTGGKNSRGKTGFSIMAKEDKNRHREISRRGGMGKK